MQEDTPQDQDNSTALEQPQVHHGSRRNLGLFSFSQSVLTRGLLLPGKTYVFMVVGRWQARDTPGKCLGHKVRTLFSSLLTVNSLDFRLYW
jgi:hypothetical protein